MSALVLIMRADQSPARKTVLSAAEIANMPLALLDPSFSTRRVIDRYFQGEGLRPRIAVEANSIPALIDLVRSTDLVTILPETVRSAGLSTLKIDPAFEPRRAALLRRRNAYCPCGQGLYRHDTRGRGGSSPRVSQNSHSPSRPLAPTPTRSCRAACW